MHFLHFFLILDFHLQRRGVDTPVSIHYTMIQTTTQTANIEIFANNTSKISPLIIQFMSYI